MADLTQDWREFLPLLISHRVKFVVGDEVARANCRWQIPFLSRELLLRNKLASGRAKDLADLASLDAPQTTPRRRTRKR